MKRVTWRLLVAVLTFSLGLAGTGLLRTLSPEQDDVSLTHDETPRNDLYREAILRSELARLRGLLDRYAAEHAGGLRPFAYPRSLDDLVRAGYLPELPLDPMTGRRDWQAEEIGCVSSGKWHSWSVVNVRSGSSAISSEGTRYNEW